MAFVGRARELEELERALAAARAGRGGAVLVTGDAGIGKTRVVSELAARAGDFDVLLGQALDLVGTELPFQPFTDALGDLGRGGSQLQVFEAALARLCDRPAPALLILEDLHWADQSTLDLVVFVAHHVHDQRVLLLATARAGEPSRLAAALRRCGRVLELGPLPREALITLLAGRADPHRLDAILARAEGNPFFAEELLAAGEELPHGLREVLLERVAGLDQELLRVAAAAGREVTYELLRATAERDVRAPLRAAVERGVLVPERDGFRFRHALLAEAVYSTFLPGEREALHARIAAELAGSAPPAELAPHWAAAGRAAEAFAASLEAAVQAEAVCGLAEALSHLERAIALWDADSGEDLAELCARAAELASQVGRAPRAAELARRAIDLAGTTDGRRASRLLVRFGEYLYESGDTGLAALERAVDVAPAGSPERAFALGSVAGGLMMARRRTESLRTAEQALADARSAGAGAAEVRALTVIGVNVAYLGRGEEGVARLREALRLAVQIDDRWGLDRVYVNFTDVLTMLGRPSESAALGREGLEVLRRYGIESTILLGNQVEALLAVGDWEEADRLSAVALRTTSFEYVPHILRADLELGRGEFAAAREQLDAAGATVHHEPGLTEYLTCVAELALWERRWMEADAAVRDGLGRARLREAPEFTLQLCTKGLRAQAELAALARARRDPDTVGHWLERADSLLAAVRAAAAAAEPITPRATACRLQAEAEHARAAGAARADRWADAADAWERAGYVPAAAYCRWRQAEALVAAGASRAAAAAPLRAAHAVAARIGAAPLRRELELLAERARLDVAPPPEAEPEGEPLLGLTPRETEVLSLVARGLTNREIADTLVISVRTAGVHVSHILRKLDAPNRLEAAAIAHRVGLQR
jgi:DNA-binding CsgD family transcriptional regulator